MIRWVVCFLIFLAGQAVVSASHATAYEAMRVLGGDRDPSVLNHILEISGQRGQSQPAVWKISVDDPLARGGVREFEVADGIVLSERTPVNPAVEPNEEALVDLSFLNLDSRAAFHIAEQEARRARVSFDSANYRLRGNGSGRSPLWTVSLFDWNQRSVGEITISAQDGRVIGARDLAAAGPNEVEPFPAGEGYGSEPFLDRAGRTMERTGRQVEKTFRGIGGTLQEFFTGRRTVDRKYQDDDN